MLAILPLLSVLTVSGARDFTPPPAVFQYRPRVEVWTDRGDEPYTGGQAVRVHFRTELDAYVTILKNGVEIVDAGPAPPNRNLPAVTNQLEGLALANIQCVKGDKIAVRLNLVNLNTIERCKVLIAYMSLISPLRGPTTQYQA